MKLIRTIVALTILLSIALLRAGDDTPRSHPRYDYEVARTHQIKPLRHTIPHAGVRPGFHQIHLTLTISPSGDVVNAEARGEPVSMGFWPELEGEVRQWKFTPFEQNGKAVTAEVEEYLDLVPPERLPTRHVAAPVLQPQSKIAVALDRTGCFGSCPSYNVTITNDGIVFQGRSFVVATGTHRDGIDRAELRALAQRFIAADFYSMDPSYRAGVTDNPTYRLSIAIDGIAKEVEDYVGSWVGMPAVITELEDAVDTLARTQRWVSGEDGLVQALRAEKFNFHTAAAQAILKEAIRHDNAATVQGLLDEGVPLTPLPVFQPKPRDTPPFEAARWLQAAGRNPQVLQALIDAGASSNDQADKDVALVRAAFFGQVESARALIAYGADPNADLSGLNIPRDGVWIRRDWPGLGNILIYAAQSGNPEMLRLILGYHPKLEARDARGRTAIFAANDGDHRSGDKDDARVLCVRLLAEAGADVNARDTDGNTPLHKLFFTDVAEELLRLGGDVNARNNDGETPLFTTGNDDIIPLFIDHGADLTIRNNHGKTALEAAEGKPTRQEALRKAMQRVSERSQ